MSIGAVASAVSPFIWKDAIARSTLGTTLKSVGVGGRLLDIPPDQHALRQRVLLREMSVLGMIFGASLALEPLFTKVIFAPLHNNPRFQKMKLFADFIPQAIGYVAAEIASRKLFPVQKTFEEALHHEDDDAEDALTAKREADDDAMPAHSVATKIHSSRSLFQTPTFKMLPLSQGFKGYGNPPVNNAFANPPANVPNYWQWQGQQSILTGFNH